MSPAGMVTHSSASFGQPFHVIAILFPSQSCDLYNRIPNFILSEVTIAEHLPSITQRRNVDMRLPSLSIAWDAWPQIVLNRESSVTRWHERLTPGTVASAIHECHYSSCQMRTVGSAGVYRIHAGNRVCETSLRGQNLPFADPDPCK